MHSPVEFNYFDEKEIKKPCLKEAWTITPLLKSIRSSPGLSICLSQINDHLIKEVGK